MNKVSKCYNAFNTILYTEIDGHEFVLERSTVDYTEDEIINEFSELIGVMTPEEVKRSIITNS